jgi:Phosphoenolpyruvate carboxylase
MLEPGRGGGEIWGPRIGIKITVIYEVTPCILVVKYQTTRRKEKHLDLINWGCMKTEAEENMSIWKRGGDGGGGGGETHKAIAEVRHVQDGSIRVTCRVRALYVWVPRAAGLANWY